MVTSPIRIAKKALLGTLFGDSSLTIHRGLANDTTKSMLTLVHGQDQFEYLLWKMHLLYPLVGSFHIKMLPSRAKGKVIVHATTTYQHYLYHIFKDYYNKVQAEDVYSLPCVKFNKVVRMNVLRRLSPLSLALWYQDDGSIYNTGNRFKGIRLATYDFSISENELIQNYFQECWGIKSELDIRNDGYPYIRLNKDASEKFLEIIDSFVHPSMRYKTMSFSQSARHVTTHDEIVCSLQQCGELVRDNQSDTKSRYDVDWSKLVNGPIALSAMRLRIE
jgi:hypothetical protein